MFDRRPTHNECCPPTVDDEVERAAQEAERISHPGTLRTSTVETVAGMTAGGVVGALAGPPGVALGIFLGGAVGAVAGVLGELEQARKDRHDAELDVDIGVYGGRIGETPSNPPPAEIDALAAAWMEEGDAVDPESDEPVRKAS